MKFVLKEILRYYLKYLTKLALLIHRPTIVAIAGSANKTFVKEEIVRILKEKGIETRSNPKSFNTEIGLPLAILDLPSGYYSYKNWLPIIFKAPFSAIGRKKFPSVFVLELGVSVPGDMKYLLSVIKPDIAFITDITQKYLDAFGDMDELAGEYEYLIKKMRKNSIIALNCDNLRIGKMIKTAKRPVISFGFTSGSDWRVLEAEKIETGQIIKIKRNGDIKNYKINRFGSHHIYALLAGLIVNYYVCEEKKI